MYFSDDPNDMSVEVWRAERSSTSSPWTVTGVQSQLSIAPLVGWPTLEHDGLTMYLEVDDGNAQLYRSTRTSITVPFGTPTPVTELNGAPGIASIGDPDVSRDGTRMVLAVTASSSATAFDIFVTTRSCL